MSNRSSNLDKIVERCLELYPNHKIFLTRRFEEVDTAERARCERLADDITKLAGTRIDDFLLGYEFICKIQKDEELYFRRHNDYRLNNFEEAFEHVYSNKPYMLNYMRGLLVSQIFWSNHTKSIGFYEDRFLKTLSSNAQLLEIGPGHGLLLARAIEALDQGCVVGWDISQASLEDTKSALDALGTTKDYSLRERNLYQSGDEKFDAVVFSEVLEHLEEPEAAMRAILQFTKPDGCVYINVPINSPAPDHLFLLRSPEEAVDFVESCGFRVIDSAFFPATNYTMEQARKHKLTVSVCLVAKPA
jgi:2-polyprenyl-3-methyl-5-hydroxy-6-metoxy-1,4-benzoquinol methylase